jgi:hypothetical protein
MVDPDELLADTPEWQHRRADDRLPQMLTDDVIRSNRAKFLLLVTLVIALVTILYVQFFQEPAPVGIHVEAAPAPQVAKVPKVAVPVTEVQAYAPPAKKKLKLPALIQQADNQHVVASTRTAPDERPHTVTTVLDTSTGSFTTFDRAEPLPWIAAQPKTELGAFVGYRGGEPALRIEARQELLQVKALHVGAIASADAAASGVDGFVGVGVWARW